MTVLALAERCSALAAGRALESPADSARRPGLRSSSKGDRACAAEDDQSWRDGYHVPGIALCVVRGCWRRPMLWQSWVNHVGHQDVGFSRSTAVVLVCA